MPIETKYDPELDIIIHEVLEAPELEDFEQAIKKRTRGEFGPATKNIIWDLSKGSQSGLKSGDVGKLLARIKSGGLMDIRAGGKTAIIVSKEGNYDTGYLWEKMINTIAPFKMKVFQSAEDALAWFREE